MNLHLHEINEVEVTRETYNEIASEYTRNLKNPYLAGSEAYHEEAMDKFVALLPDKEHRVLDLGCGFGLDLGSFLERGLEIIGIDISEGMLALAQQRFPKIELHKMDMRQLNFNKGRFGGVWASHCLYHVPKRDIGRVIEQIKHVLVAQGAFFSSLKLGCGEGIDREVQSVSYPGKPRFYALYTEAEVKDMLRDFDFINLDIKPETYYGSGWIYVWAKKRVS